MAFQQPTRQAIQRPPREASQERGDTHGPHAPNAPVAALAESQTWVLFSPTTADTETASSILDSLPESSQQTAGRSRRSDLGSFRSLVRSNYASSYAQSTFARPANLQLSLLTSARAQTSDEEAVAESEDDAELDSLDSHLADFRPAQAQTQGQPAPLHMTNTTTTTTTVHLPTHDGLGSFRLGNTTAGMSSAVQEHLYTFEQFNPRRVTKRRRESLDFAQFEAGAELAEEIERTRRIEAWRWEHSRILLEEVQKETRRRRGSELSARRSAPLEAGAASDGSATATAPGATADDAIQGDTGGDWHDQDEDARLSRLRKAAGEDESEEKEGLWSRITRKFMLEVMGIDDRILSVLFGEALAEEEEGEAGEMDLSSTPKASNPILNAAAAGMDTVDDDLPDEDAPSSSSWQLRMLERIAKELGMFVHSHMNSHPGAFSTFVRVQQMPLPYAGLPAIPEAAAPSLPHGAAVAGGGAAGDALLGDKATDDATPTGTTASLPRFKPTIYQAQPIGIPGQAAAESTPLSALSGGGAGSVAGQSTSTTSHSAQAFTQDEWEQDLDITLVFRYLRSRFFSGSSPSSSHAHRHHHSHHSHHSLGLGHGGSGSALSMQDAAAKAARVRQHHPLVGRGSTGRQAGERRPMAAYRNKSAAAAAAAAPSSPVLGMRHGHGRGHGHGGVAASCASQSTRRSARRSSISSRHSSRHYWDLGGSIGTGSMIASAGPTGSWGEV